jgi:hypothetical protein
VKPAPLLARPKLQPQDMRYLRAYQTIEDGRTGGVGGPNPIPLSDISAYCDLAGIDKASERLKYLRLVRRLDRAYLEHWAEKHPPKTS